MKLFLIVVVIVLGIFSLSGEDYECVSHRYVVRQGDTVWDIAEKHMDGQAKIRDVRELCWEIKEKNNLHNYVIHAGQVLEIPLWQRKNRPEGRRGKNE